MKKKEQLEIFWIHVIVTFCLCLFLFPLAPLTYLFGLALYYGGRAALRVLKNRPARSTYGSGPNRSEFAYNLVYRLTWSVGLAFLSASILIASLVFSTESATSIRYPTALEAVLGIVMFTVGFTPVWFGVLLALSVPFRLWRWMKNRGDRQRREVADREYEARQTILRREVQEAADIQQKDLRRRIEARARCELLYTLHAHEISERFPKAMLDDFMKKYMNDAHSAEDVERRGEELRGIIERHAKGDEAGKKPSSIQELTEWYVAERDRVEALPIDNHFKEYLRTQLKTRYSELSDEILARMQP